MKLIRDTKTRSRINRAFKWANFMSLLFIDLFTAHAAEDRSAITEALKSSIDPAIRVLNVLVLSSVGLFIVMIAVSSYKFATSQGDPKGMQGAKETLTNSFLGFFVSFGFFIIIQVSLGVFGGSVGTDPGGSFRGAINDLIILINDTYTN